MLPLYRVIFELLWRDYFKFVAVKYGNRLFQVEGTIALPVNSVSVMQKVILKLMLPFFIFRTSRQICRMENGHEAFRCMERFVLFLVSFQVLSACYFLLFLKAL